MEEAGILWSLLESRFLNLIWIRVKPGFHLDFFAFCCSFWFSVPTKSHNEQWDAQMETSTKPKRATKSHYEQQKAFACFGFWDRIDCYSMKSSEKQQKAMKSNKKQQRTSELEKPKRATKNQDEQRKAQKVQMETRLNKTGRKFISIHCTLDMSKSKENFFQIINENSSI